MENQNQSINRSYILPIAVMYMLWFMIAFVTNFAGSMGVIVKNQFGASNAMAQLGTVANFLAYLCMGIPGGIILKRKGYKFTSLLAVAIGFVGVGIQWLSGPMESFGIYVLGAFVAGFSMCLLNIVVNPMCNTLGGGGKRGNQLCQFGGTCNSIGATLAPILLGYLIGGEAAKAGVSDAAPAMIAALAIFAFCFIVVLLTRIPEPHIETPEQREARAHDSYSPMSFRHFILGIVAIFCYIGVEVGIPNMANLYMSNDPKVGAVVAGTVVGLYWLMMMVGRLLGGLLGGVLSSKQMLTAVSAMCIVMLLCVMLFPTTWVVTFKGVELPISMIIMFLCGLMTSVMWGAIFNLATEGLGKYTPAASGIFMTMVCGGGILTFLQGALADKIGYLHSYALPIVCLVFILFYALFGCKNVNEDIPTE